MRNSQQLLKIKHNIFFWREDPKIMKIILLTANILIPAVRTEAGFAISANMR